MFQLEGVQLNILPGGTHEIILFIPCLIGHAILLQNGCILLLDDLNQDYYLITAINPYGINAFFTSFDSLRTWLNYWDLQTKGIT